MPRTPTPDPRPSRQRGGRRPGAGAPRGNLNGLKSGKHSARVRALQVALQLAPSTADLMRRIDAAGSGRSTEFARALHYIADLILMGKIQSIDFQENAAEQIRDIIKNFREGQM